MIHFPVPEVEAFGRRERPRRAGEREPAAEIPTLSLAKGRDLVPEDQKIS